MTNVSKRHNGSIARKRQRRRELYGIWRKGKNRNKIGISRQKIPIIAPSEFSFNQNAEAVISFANTLERFYNKGQPVQVKLDDVTEIDPGALLLLIAVMIKFRRDDIAFNGTMPKNVLARRMLKESGFIEILYQKNPLHKQEDYILRNGGKNEIITHGMRRVDPELAYQVIGSASKSIWGAERRCPGAYATIIELMHNTHNHADVDIRGVQHWWLFVRHDEVKKIASFAFVDLGVGIFESLRNKPHDSIWKKGIEVLSDSFKYNNNAEFLKLILNGDLQRAISVTGEEYRGKGLPAIARCVNSGQILNLRIISNDAHAAPEIEKYELMSKSFNGTYIYWELGENNESII